MPEPETKAHALHVMHTVLKRMVPAAELTTWIETLPAELRNALVNPPVAVSWVDAHSIARLYDHLLRGLFHGNESRLVELGRLSMLEDFKGIFKLLARFISPQGMAKRGAAMWDHYQRNNGAVSVVNVEETGAEVRYVGVRCAGRTFWLFQQGLLQAAMEATGSRNVKVALKSQNGPDAVFELRRRADETPGT